MSTDSSPERSSDEYSPSILLTGLQTIFRGLAAAVTIFGMGVLWSLSNHITAVTSFNGLIVFGIAVLAGILTAGCLLVSELIGVALEAMQFLHSIEHSLRPRN